MRTAIQSKLRDTGLVCEDKDTGLVTRIASWSELLVGNSNNNSNKALFFYGTAIHVITDAFAHSTYYNGIRINHDSGADSVAHIPNRYKCAEYFTKRALEHILLFEAGNVTDISCIMPVYDGSFKMGFLSSYVKAISLEYYNHNYTFLDRINID